MSRKSQDPRPYDGPAGGWPALGAVAEVLADQATVIEGGRSLLAANQQDGFDCPGCAWPDPNPTSTFEFCENGAKAVAWEATSRRATPEVIAQYSVSELRTWSDHPLEDLGRLTEPMAYDRATDRYVRLTWDEALAQVGTALRQLPDPNMAEFYASGRASNEAAFLFQLLARRFGTNNLPDCSNMCHEPTSVALPDVIGVGKGTVTLEDFDHCDTILSFGHNPGTNHPRMMASLREASRRGAQILVFNPLRERALERFASPQDPVEMATLGSTPIAHRYYQLKIGGDQAVLLGMMKTLIETGRINRDFLDAHTAGFPALESALSGLDWLDLETRSGLTRAAIEDAADLYAQSKATILCYGMGITQHRGSSNLVQQLMNLLLLGGHIGRPGAGICPLRGHSNVQGARSVGVAEKPSPAFLTALERVFSFAPPKAHGHTVVEAIEAMQVGQAKVLICLGGNFAVAAPDPILTWPAIERLELMVNIATKLNRTHLLIGNQALLLPCLGRTEIDVQATGRQAVTVEDSMSMVHASRGLNPPASPHLRSEPAIIAGIAQATFGPDPAIDWMGLAGDYRLIRDLIAQTLPEGFADYNQRITRPGGFRLPVPASERVWRTASGRATIILPDLDAPDLRRDDDAVLILTTLRSHDQYNTTIYGLNDRYRGIKGRRDVVFADPEDLAMRGLKDGDRIDLEAAFPSNAGDTLRRRVSGFLAVAKAMPKGCIAAYYPETNALIHLADRDQRSGTPAYKSVPVRMVRHNP